MKKMIKVTSKSTFSPLISWLAFSFLLFVFKLIYSSYFPLQNMRLGEDYAYILPNLLDGAIWFENNGFIPPWFTPSFCAGQPSFPDPQSSYYALPQLLSFIVSPLTAIIWTFYICASALFWGGYLLMRQIFRTGVAAALLVGGILMFNGFLPHRMMEGHVGYHGFSLIPWMALLLLLPTQKLLNELAAAIVAGILMAYWVYSGFGTLIIPGILAVILIIIFRCINNSCSCNLLVRVAIATSVAAGISAAKLWAIFSFLSNFPRTLYLLPGAESVYDSMAIIAGALFLPSEWAHKFGSPLLKNTQWRLEPHEWAFNFSFAVAFLGIALVINKIIKKRSWFHTSSRWFIHLFFLLLIVMIPVALNFAQPSWTVFLKSLPVFGSSSNFLRWIIIYIPILAVLTGFSLERSGWGIIRTYATLFCLFATVLQAALEPRDFYLSRSYDARPIVMAYQQMSEGKLIKEISKLGFSAKFNYGNGWFETKLNDTLVAGVSQIYCYNPVFGYRLENFYARDILSGSVFLVMNNKLNIKNPVCYVYPDENNCLPGDRFRSDQISQVNAFIQYHPFYFLMSKGQKLANLVTCVTIIFVVLFSICFLVSCFFVRYSCFRNLISMHFMIINNFWKSFCKK